MYHSSTCSLFLCRVFVHFAHLPRWPSSIDSFHMFWVFALEPQPLRIGEMLQIETPK